MPLCSIREIHADVRLGIWHISESVEELLAACPQLTAVLETVMTRYHASARRLETLSVYALLFHMTGDSTLRITHNERRAPIVEGWHISISHTRGYAAVVLSRSFDVAVDIEYIHERVTAIAARFLRQDEHAPSLISKLIHWCAKETLYKLFSAEDLHFHDMRVLPFDERVEGDLMSEDCKCPKRQTVSYQVTPGYVLTYAWR